MAREMMAQEGKNMAMVQEGKTWQVYCFGKRNVKVEFERVQRGFLLKLFVVHL